MTLSPIKKEKTKGGRKREGGKEGSGRPGKGEEEEAFFIYISGMQFTITFGPWYPWIWHLQIQPTTDRKYSQNVSLLNMYGLFDVTP